jgi:hypothetical protein
MTQEYLNEIAKAAQREYHRQWRKNNPELKAASNQRYWQNRALKAIQADNERRKQESNGGKA